MVLRLLEGFLVGIFLFAFIYLGGTGLLAQYFFDSGYLYKAELPRVSELQNLIDSEELSLNDTDRLFQWAEERRIQEFQIYEDDILLYDVTGDAPAVDEGGAVALYGNRYLYDVTFPEGTVQVYLYEGAGNSYYQLLLLLSLAIGFFSFLSIFLSGLKQYVRYIQTLRNEVETFTSGDLSRSVAIVGDSELTDLARGLDQMRLSLLEKEAKEQEMRAAQKKMVLGMSHDLKTPLTGLLAYMEIMKQEQANGEVSAEYLDKAYHQILQMRNLSNRMFEYFLIDSIDQPDLESAEAAESVLGDYLSEFCALLGSLGFQIDTDRIVWQEGAMIRINTDYMGRIMNNLISNMKKYADRSEPVHVIIQYEPDTLCLLIRNKIQIPNLYVEGTGIGTKNIELMMKQMGGEFSITMDAAYYISRLYFPLSQSSDK